MNSDHNARPKHISPRNWAIVSDTQRYRLITPKVIQQRHMPTQQLNAVTKVTGRLVRSGWLCKYPLYHPRVYFTLGPVAARHLGVSMQRTLPLGPQALPIDYAAMVYATSHNRRRSRLTNAELLDLVPELPPALADFVYCVDESESPPVIELIRVDLGGKPDHVARKCDTDIELRKPVKTLMNWMRRGRFRLVVITATEDKSAAIRNSLAQHVWPSGLTIHLAIVPELMHLTASTSYGT